MNCLVEKQKIYKSVFCLYGDGTITFLIVQEHI